MNYETNALRAAKPRVAFCSQNNVHALNQRRDVVGFWSALRATSVQDRTDLEQTPGADVRILTAITVLFHR